MASSRRFIWMPVDGCGVSRYLSGQDPWPRRNPNPPGGPPRGKGRVGGIVVRATDRFVEAYRLAQDSKAWELLPSSRLSASPRR